MGSAEERSNSPPDLPDWPQQQLRGHALEGYRYTSREFMQSEWEHMWTRVWLLLGREDEIPNPGDWQQEEANETLAGTTND